MSYYDGGGLLTGSDCEFLFISDCFTTGNLNNDISSLNYFTSIGGYSGGGLLTGSDTICNFIINCYTTGNLNNDISGIGIFGYSGGGLLTGSNVVCYSIIDCYTTGNLNNNISGEYNGVYSGGGLLTGSDNYIAETETTQTIQNCHTTGNLKNDISGNANGGYDGGGGLFGSHNYDINSDNTGSIILVSDCYTTGDIKNNISGSANVYNGGGGLFGSTNYISDANGGGSMLVINSHTTGNIENNASGSASGYNGGGGLFGANGYDNDLGFSWMCVVNCYTTGDLKNDLSGYNVFQYYGGGLFTGSNNYSMTMNVAIINCYTSGNLTNDYSGYGTSEVDGCGYYGGGLFNGSNNFNFIVLNSYTTGNLTNNITGICGNSNYEYNGYDGGGLFSGSDTIFISFSNCYTTGNLINNIAGIIYGLNYSGANGGSCFLGGFSYECSVSNCYTTGNITNLFTSTGILGQNGMWGGGCLVGAECFTTNVVNCYASGNVMNGPCIISDNLMYCGGGIFGASCDSSNTISNCYFSGVNSVNFSTQVQTQIQSQSQTQSQELVNSSGNIFYGGGIYGACDSSVYNGHFDIFNCYCTLNLPYCGYGYNLNANIVNNKYFNKFFKCNDSSVPNTWGFKYITYTGNQNSQLDISYFNFDINTSWIPILNSLPLLISNLSSATIPDSSFTLYPIIPVNKASTFFTFSFNPSSSTYFPINVIDHPNVSVINYTSNQVQLSLLNGYGFVLLSTVITCSPNVTFLNAESQLIQYYSTSADQVIIFTNAPQFTPVTENVIIGTGITDDDILLSFNNVKRKNNEYELNSSLNLDEYNFIKLNNQTEHFNCNGYRIYGNSQPFGGLGILKNTVSSFSSSASSSYIDFITGIKYNSDNFTKSDSTIIFYDSNILIKNQTPNPNQNQNQNQNPNQSQSQNQNQIESYIRNVNLKHNDDLNITMSITNKSNKILLTIDRNVLDPNVKKFNYTIKLNNSINPSYVKVTGENGEFIKNKFNNNKRTLKIYNYIGNVLIHFKYDKNKFFTGCSYVLTTIGNVKLSDLTVNHVLHGDYIIKNIQKCYAGNSIKCYSLKKSSIDKYVPFKNTIIANNYKDNIDSSYHKGLSSVRIHKVTLYKIHLYTTDPIDVYINNAILNNMIMS